MVVTVLKQMHAFQKYCFKFSVAYLQTLLLGGERVDDADPAGLGRKQAHLIAAVSPPRTPKIINPVCARAGRGHMHEASHGGVVFHTAR